MRMTSSHFETVGSTTHHPNKNLPHTNSRTLIMFNVKCVPIERKCWLRPANVHQNCRIGRVQKSVQAVNQP